MADVVDPATRSRMMAGIRHSNTRPEREIRRALHRLGFRFRLHVKGMMGRPDIVLPKWKAVILVHGCFWHRHPGCRFATTPSTRAEFWQTKFESNVARDARGIDELTKAGWRVALVWECAVRSEGAEAIGVKLDNWIRSSGLFVDIGISS